MVEVFIKVVSLFSSATIREYEVETPSLTFLSIVFETRKENAIPIQTKSKTRIRKRLSTSSVQSYGLC